MWGNYVARNWWIVNKWLRGSVFWTTWNKLLFLLEPLKYDVNQENNYKLSYFFSNLIVKLKLNTMKLYLSKKILWNFTINEIRETRTTTLSCYYIWSKRFNKNCKAWQVWGAEEQDGCHIYLSIYYYLCKLNLTHSNAKIVHMWHL